MKLYQIKVVDGAIITGVTHSGDLTTLKEMVTKEPYLFVHTSENDPFYPNEIYYINTNHIVWISEVQEKD